MHLEYKNSVILITGASAGIGYEFARQLAPHAKALVLVARRVERLNDLKASLNTAYPDLIVSVQACDLTLRDEMDRMLGRVSEELGTVDILINNAGMGDFALYESSSWKKLDQMYQLNIFAPSYLSWRLIGEMAKNRKGGILNVSSTAGLHFFPGFAAYVGTKFFVNGFTESLRSEHQGSGVVISQLSPGPVATEFEAVASNGAKGKIPSWIEISPETCVRWALRGFAKGKALIVPGYLMWMSVALFRLAPMPLRRFAAGRMNEWIRKAKLTQPA